MHIPFFHRQRYFSLLIFLRYLVSFFAVPIVPNWKEELKRLTDAINLPASLPKAQPANPMPGLPSRQGTRQGSRQGSRQASRDALRKMENEFVRNSLSRGGQRLSGEGMNQEGERPPTRPSETRDGNMNVVEQANEEFVSNEFIFIYILFTPAE